MIAAIEGGDGAADSPRGSSSMRMPRGGRLLMMVKGMPAVMQFATAALARSVRSFSAVTKVPSTSDTTRG